MSPPSVPPLFPFVFCPTRICFRQEKGYCRIQYTPTPDANSFKLTGRLPMSKSTVGSFFCQGDYLFIPQGRNADSDGALDGVGPVYTFV